MSVKDSFFCKKCLLCYYCLYYLLFVLLYCLTLMDVTKLEQLFTIILNNTFLGWLFIRQCEKKWFSSSVLLQVLHSLCWRGIFLQRPFSISKLWSLDRRSMSVKDSFFGKKCCIVLLLFALLYCLYYCIGCITVLFVLLYWLYYCIVYITVLFVLLYCLYYCISYSNTNNTVIQTIP
jgi:hypothetical protein